MTKDNFEIVYWLVTIGVLIVNIWVIAHSPINAVKVGRKLNDEQQKDNAKRSLFLTLFAYRGSPVHIDFVKALNQIDIVFHDTPTVLQAWQNYYTSVGIQNQVNEEKIWELLRVDLLSQMAQSLGYSAIKQTDMTKHYYPTGNWNLWLNDYNLKKAAYDFLEREILSFRC